MKENITYNFNKINLEILNKEYFVMANSTYKTKILKDSGLKLLEKTFYVDMQYNIIPILHVDNFKFYNLDIYRYFIGRPDQSMNLNNFIQNRANHEKVLKYLIEYFNININNLSTNKKKYITQILFYMLTTHYYIYCVYPKRGSKEAFKEIKAFDKYLKNKNKDLYLLMNNIGHIRYNRLTGFLFVRIQPQSFSKLVNAIGKAIK